MAGELRLLVITPEKVVFDRTVESVGLPGSEGRFGILRNHAPLLAALEAGELVATEPGGEKSIFFIADGFVEVVKNLARVVVDSGEAVSEIDLKRAREAEERARTRIAERQKVDFDLPRAEAALRRALMRARLGRRYKDAGAPT